MLVHRCYIVSSDLSDIEINVAKLLVGLIDSEVQLEQHLHKITANIKLIEMECCACLVSDTNLILDSGVCL